MYVWPFDLRIRQARNRKIFLGEKSLFLIFSQRDFRFFPEEIPILVDLFKVSVVSWSSAFFRPFYP